MGLNRNCTENRDNTVNTNKYETMISFNIKVILLIHWNMMVIQTGIST